MWLSSPTSGWAVKWQVPESGRTWAPMPMPPVKGPRGAEAGHGPRMLTCGEPSWPLQWTPPGPPQAAPESSGSHPFPDLASPADTAQSNKVSFPSQLPLRLG